MYVTVTVAEPAGVRASLQRLVDLVGAVQAGEIDRLRHVAPHALPVVGARRAIHTTGGRRTDPGSRRRGCPLADSRKRSIVNRDGTRLPDPRQATMLRLGSNRSAEHRLGVPPVTIQQAREPSTATAIVAGDARGRSYA